MVSDQKTEQGLNPWQDDDTGTIERKISKQFFSL
jgi:hypothetical protein